MPTAAAVGTGSVLGLGEGAQTKGGGAVLENGDIRGRDAGAEEKSKSQSGEGRRDSSAVPVAFNAASFALSDDALHISRSKAAGAGNGDAGAEMETTL